MATVLASFFFVRLLGNCFRQTPTYLIFIFLLAQQKKKYSVIARTIVSQKGFLHYIKFYIIFTSKLIHFKVHCTKLYGLPKYYVENKMKKIKKKRSQCIWMDGWIAKKCKKRAMHPMTPITSKSLQKNIKTSNQPYIIYIGFVYFLAKFFFFLFL